MNGEKTINGILYSNNKNLLQIEVIHKYLNEESYWAKGIPFKLLHECINGSVCFAAYSNNKQIAFARLITDGATFGYLADVFVMAQYRGKGIANELMKFVMEYEPVTKLRRFMLATKDAHSLYEKYGFKPLAEPERFMEIKSFENYSVK